MYRTSSRAKAARSALGSCALLALFGGLAAAPANAVSVSSVTITNSYGYSIGGSSVNVPVGGSSQTSYVGSAAPAALSELGLNYNATADAGGFYFLHDQYCVGDCHTYSQTTITFNLTTDDAGGDYSRFDSQITPGHLARLLGSNTDNSGSFTFDVSQLTTPIEGTASPHSLYSASGSVGPSSISVDKVVEGYNGFNIQTGPHGLWEVYDWGTTNLNVNLEPIYTTAQLTYTATYHTSGYDSCADIFQCSGLEVAFGDPRNDGAVTLAASFGLRAFISDAVTLNRPVIGGIYDPHFVTYDFVPAKLPSGDPYPLPPPQDDPPKWKYNRLFQSNVLGVPEPASWAMMIAGFGLVGSAARRRRAVLQAA